MRTDEELCKLREARDEEKRQELAGNEQFQKWITMIEDHWVNREGIYLSEVDNEKFKNKFLPLYNVLEEHLDIVSDCYCSKGYYYIIEGC